MLSISDKEKIDRKISLLHLENMSAANEGKVIRVVHTLYSDSIEKKCYLVRAIAQQNLVLASKSIKDLPVKSILQEDIEEIMAEIEEGSPEESVIPAIVFYYLGNTKKMVENLSIYVSKETNTEAKNDRISRAQKKIRQSINNKKDFINFFMLCVKENCLPEDILVSLMRGKFEETIQFQDEIKEILVNLEKNGYDKVYVKLVQSLGVKKAISLYELDVYDYIEKLEVFPIAPRMIQELYVYQCLESSDDTIYKKFRKKYQSYLPQGIKSYIKSFFREYIEDKCSFEEFCEAVLSFDEEIPSSILKDEDVFWILFEALEKAIYANEDVHRFLLAIEKVNYSKLTEHGMLPIFEYYISANTMNKIERLEDYLIETYAVQDLLNVYFNSCLKVLLDIRIFFTKVLSRYDSEEVRAVLETFSIPGKFKYYGKYKGIIIGLWNIKAFSTFYYDGDCGAGFAKGDDLWMELTIIENKITVKDVYRTEGESERVQVQKWEKCLTILEDLTKKNITKADPAILREIKNHSDVKLSIVEKRLEELVELLLKISTKPYLFMQIIAGFSWISYYLYKNELETRTKDFSLYIKVEESCIQIVKNLLANEIGISNLISIYMNTFLRLVLSIWEIADIAVEKYTPTEIKNEFDKYVFWGFFRKQNIFMNLRGVRTSGCYDLRLADNKEKKYNRSYLIVIDEINYIQKKVIFVESDTDDDIHAPYNEAILDELVRRYKSFGKKPTCSEEEYERLINTDIKLYSGNERVCMEIHNSLKNAIFYRRYYVSEIIKMLKTLSFHNIYCARTYYYLKNDFIREFQFLKEEKTQATETLKIIVRNAKRLNDCFFVFINSYLKQNISVSEFFEICGERKFVDGLDFEMNFNVIGTIRNDENSQKKVFHPINIGMDCALEIPQKFQNFKGTENVAAYIKMTHMDGETTYEILTLKQLSMSAETEN